MTFDETPYWQQYDFAEWVTARDVDPGLAVDPDSDLLLSGGVTLETPVDGLELFAGYAENFKSLADRLLEVPGRSLAALEPGTATNGMRYSGDRVALGATWYDIDFDNRIFFLGPTTTAGPNYLISGGGAYFNAGGIDTSGVELSARVQMPGRTSFYTACTFNDSQYVDTGEALVDASQNIEPGTDVTGVPDRLWVLSLDRPGPLGMSISDKYTSSRRVSLTADWYADAYWLVDAYLTFSVDGLGGPLQVDGGVAGREQPLRRLVSRGDRGERGVAGGAAHTRFARSISVHAAPRTSPDRAAVSTRNSSASLTTGLAVDPCIVRAPPRPRDAAAPACAPRSPADARAPVRCDRTGCPPCTPSPPPIPSLR